MTDEHKKQCGCSKEQRHEGWAACRGEDIFQYWCKTCNRSVPEARCPYCGLKAQKKKGVTGERPNKR